MLSIQRTSQIRISSPLMLTMLLLFLLPMINNAAAQGIPSITIIELYTDRNEYEAGDEVTITVFLTNASPRETLDLSISATAEWIDGETVESEQFTMRPGDSRVITIVLPSESDVIGPKILSVIATGIILDDPDANPVRESHLAQITFPDAPQPLSLPIFLAVIIGVLVAVVVIGARGWSRP